MYSPFYHLRIYRKLCKFFLHSFSTLRRSQGYKVYSHKSFKGCSCLLMCKYQSSVKIIVSHDRISRLRTFFRRISFLDNFALKMTFLINFGVFYTITKDLLGFYIGSVILFLNMLFIVL